MPSWREAQLQLHGWMIPATLVNALPDELKEPVLDTPLWKVIATLGIVLFLAAVVLLLRRGTEPKREEYSPASYLRRFLMPVVMMGSRSSGRSSWSANRSMSSATSPR